MKAIAEDLAEMNEYVDKDNYIEVKMIYLCSIFFFPTNLIYNTIICFSVNINLNKSHFTIS